MDENCYSTLRMTRVASDPRGAENMHVSTEWQTI